MIEHKSRQNKKRKCLKIDNLLKKNRIENRKKKIEILRSDIGFFNYLKYLANESKAEKWVKRHVTR